MPDEALVEVWRGNLRESMHRGHVAVVDDCGRLRASWGDPDYTTYFRSAAKPLQLAACLVQGDIAGRFQLEPAELAVMTGSHSGKELHCRAVAKVLAKIGLAKSDLQCGVHWPVDRSTSNELVRTGQRPCPLQNTCSGKHAAMLALAIARSWDTAGYLCPNHPVQLAIGQVIAELVGMAWEEIILGVDGCGVPVYGLPLRNMALGFARLAVPDRLEPALAGAIRTTAAAMAAQPEMVAGDGRICTELIRVTRGRVLAKVGGEAVYGLALPQLGLGVALKIEDGSERALSPAVVEILSQLTAITPAEKDSLQKFHTPAIRNFRGDIVGQFKPAFQLKMVPPSA